jgi:hypothetical protein
MRRSIVVLFTLCVPLLSSAQEQPSIQNPQEVEIAAKFEQAAPSLFKGVA